MTAEDMRKELYEYCEAHECSECRIYERDINAHQPCKVFLDRGGTDKMSEDDISRYYAMIHKSEPGADQSAKADAGKENLTLVPQEIIWDIARTREYGTKKYGGDPDNWKRVEIERFRAAAFRHLLKYLGDPHGYDEESGLPHLYHLATNVSFLCAMETYWEGVVGDGIPGHIEPKHECNHCEYYGGVHEVMGHAPCEHPEVGTSAVLWNETCKYWKLHEGYKS